ncbi:unnamed protein product [Effrenium voratum]|uniref:Uncharacterized protein n=1 Tax=Effrenium voratum TaxID=2562239 RepID=A0AA36NKG5_9DINO|nr:unnamed protein product [Effrenium voratum]CAJ1410794.1 unnamed protein product [Effrenium voratum]CAJ1457797.1 unnamed protein product [Effrenium voratum]
MTSSTASTSSSKYKLYWYDVSFGQYVFEASDTSEASEASGGLARVSSVQDLLEHLELLSGDKEMPTKLTVGGLALLGGNLIAQSQFKELLLFVLLYLVLGVFGTAGSWTASVARSATVALVAYLVKAVYDGVSMEWAVTVSVVMFLAVMAVMLVRMASREDPRSYVLLEDEGDVADIDATFGLRNLCFMDVKVLCFDVDDRVQFIPLGGLLPKDAVLPRNAWKSFAERERLVKIFSPFETELGTWRLSGRFSLRATAPPVHLSPHPRPVFKNCSESLVMLCICERSHWTSSLWLPFSQFIARVTWPGQKVAPNAEVPLPQRPCVVRVYTGLVFGWGGFFEKACCMLEPGEQVEYDGGITWSRPKTFGSFGSFGFSSSFKREKRKKDERNKLEERRCQCVSP